MPLPRAFMQRCVGGGAAALFTAKIISQCFMDSTFQLISDTERSITSETANWYRVAHTQYFTLFFFLQLHPPQFHVHPHETEFLHFLVQLYVLPKL
jgi:hypothetical protein